MLNQLENISLVLDFIPAADAKRLIDAVNLRLADMLGAHIIDVLWRREAKDGILLDPYCWIDRSRRRRPVPYLIPNEVRDDRSGLWTYVYRTGQPVWIENIRRKNLSQPVKNLATGADIDPKYLYIFEQTDSFMAAPLMFRDTVRGVYSIELPISDRLSEEVLELLQRLSNPVATIIWKADAQLVNQDHTTTAISQFTDSIRNYAFQEVLNTCRMGFFARSFKPEFTPLQDCINRVLHESGIHAQPFIARPGRQSNTTDDMMSQISASHFGIADITGCYPNVMLELGMMMILRKKLFLLRSKAETQSLPFDVSSFHFYEYEILNDDGNGPAINLWSPADNRFEPVEPALGIFIKELFGDPSFVAARPWSP